MTGKGEQRPRRWRVESPFLVAAALLVIGQLLMYLSFARLIPLSGDEGFYVTNARLIAAALRDLPHFDAAAARELLDRLVDLGWFMPGMSFVLAPVALVTDSIPAFRLAFGLLNLGVAVAILWQLRRQGALAPLVFAVGVLIVPYYSVFAFTAWGDLLAAQLLLLLFLVVLRRFDSGDPRALSWRAAAGSGFALGLLTYVRGFYWSFSPIFAVLLFLGTAGLPSMWTRVVHGAGRTAVFVAVLLATILPWTVVVSARYGFHFTTTSTALAQILVFGDRSYLDRALGPGNVFYGIQRFVASRAAEERRTFAAQAAVERARATAGVSPLEKSRRMAANARRFFFDSEAFLERFRRLSVPHAGPFLQPRLDGACSFLKAVNFFGWRLLLACGLGIFFLPIGVSRRHLSLSVVYKAAVLVFTMHPLMAMASGRYYVEYVPFFAAAVATLTTMARPRLCTTWPRGSVDEWLVLVLQALSWAVGAVLLLGYCLFS